MLDPIEERPGADKKGLSHVVAATRNSLAGARVVWREDAARQEVFLFGFTLVALWFFDARVADYLVMVILFLILFAVEALNTAIENVVDHTSPKFSDYAADTKDMGSFAVFCLLTAIGLYGCAVIARFFGLIVW